MYLAWGLIPFYLIDFFIGWGIAYSLYKMAPRFMWLVPAIGMILLIPLSKLPGDLIIFHGVYRVWEEIIRLRFYV